VTLLLQGVVGSQAYGLATPESDIDRLGVFVDPLPKVFSLGYQSGTRVTKDELGDKTLHEFGKFVSLAAQCNPTVMELLWLDQYTDIEWRGKRLVESRELFLSTRAISAYMGYASQQAKRLLARGDFDPDLKKRTEKHGRHCWRLFIQGNELSQTGVLRVRLSPQEAAEAREMGEYAAKEPEKFHDMIDRGVAAMKDAKTVLPDKPDYEAINNLIYWVRTEGGSR
jgi:predicted nucleotidyltransferase